ncbi:unnamed protein product [Ambrosiozyma monospora]|uniref:Unnamed protein product n=1 Tax=Ambrosiozyma monospora TaxID=43982 RepID=A0A9W6Z8Y7_AMBMO|nr:unnamed protein product [Ambrosiozyma monospora]
MNPSTQQQHGLFHPLPLPEGRWTHITMDFLTGIPTTENGFDCIMVIVDRLSKRSHFIPTTKTLTSQGAAQLYLDNVFKHHGIPQKSEAKRS